MDGDERIRLFCALRFGDDVLDELVEWQQAFAAHDVRVVPRGNLHATLAFLGWVDAVRVSDVARELAEAAAGVPEVVLRSDRYRETRSAGMLVCADEGGDGTRLAEALWDRLERLGVYRRENRPWLPHVTVARYRRPPRLRPGLPDLGPFGAVRAAVYRSVLRPEGARYEVLEDVRLGG